MFARVLIMTAALLGSGLALGRKVINEKIEKRLPAEIETAKTAAIAELDKQIGQVVRERLSAFGISLCIKAGAIGSAYLLYFYGHLSATGLKIVAFTFIFAFLARDASKTIPYMAPALRLARAHNWSARRALTEFVAGVTFERTYAEAMIAMETGPNRLWLALSKYNAHKLSTEVATAVADVARTASYRRVRSRVVLGASLALVMAGVYAAFFMLTVGAA